MAPVHRKTSSAPKRHNRADGAATRSRILECAGELFAATGYAETTAKSIAAAAQADVASINYHFGSRAGLYQSVVIEAHRRFISRDLLATLERSAAPARAKLELLIEALVEGALSRREWHSRVLARETFAPSSALQALARYEGLPKLEVIGRLISELTGIPLGDPAIARCLVNITTPCLVLFVAPDGVPGPLEALRRMPKADLIAHLQRFAIAGLKATARDYIGRASPRARGRRG